ncbi:hypothetical protein C8R44DRAFT_886965 [Mycena epipterygia]|nr:hypothetical protein C8R44DRAFT_886965 [Mycena epipterygia]
MTSASAAASTEGSSPTSATSSASSARADWLDISLLTAKTITAAAECVPFPYVKGVCGTVVVLLETIEKVKKNRDDWKELCETTMNIITIVHSQLLVHGDSGATHFKQLCEELEKYIQSFSVEILAYLHSFLQEAYDGAQLLHKEPKGFRGWINKIVKLRSTSDEISKYGKTIQELRSNFVLAATMGVNFHLAKALPIVPLNSNVWVYLQNLV